MMMEKLSTVLVENLGRYEKGLLLPQIPPIKSVKVVNQSSLNIKEKKKVAVSAEIIMKNGFNQILNAYDRFFENQSDPEGVHQVRVRIRKFRAILAFFMPLFKNETYQRQQDILRKMGQQFSEVRQLDVLLEGVSEMEKNANLEISTFGKIKDHLQGKREMAFNQLMADLETDAFALDLLDIWVWKLNDPWEAGSPDLQVTLKDYTEKYLDSWLKKIKKSMENLDIKDQQAIHRVRIKSKKLRYVIEQLSSILDRKTRKSMEAFEKMQDDLGYYHDVFANQHLLEQLVSASDDCHLHYQAGIIIGWQMMAGNRKIKKFIN
ncbi:CHAD domain-containing protein [Acetobacterium sp.]|uniref:CHAD domain-containing protein n=1 Tax=Acetobacterium sp. TaxID=1872094 RepID=UPI002726FAFF|nr:CHAD domain-containing protein [Acetobacterium sp.]MDO9492549.1 CHAD domain-containing protein [Acetobacterium sp.]